MGWGVKTQIVAALSVNNTTDADSQFPSFASTSVSLNPGETAEVQISATFPATSANDLLYRVVTTQDDADTNFDSLAFIAGGITRAASSTFSKTILVSGVSRFRVEFRKNGTASETITVNCYSRKDGVSA